MAEKKKNEIVITGINDFDTIKLNLIFESSKVELIKSFNITIFYLRFSYYRLLTLRLVAFFFASLLALCGIRQVRKINLNKKKRGFVQRLVLNNFK